MTLQHIQRRVTAGAAMIGMAGLLMAPLAHADFANGNFASGDFTNWTENGFLNHGIASLTAATPTTPLTVADLGLQSPGSGTYSAVLAAGSANNTNNTLSWSGQAARINDDNHNNGKNRHTSSIDQSITIGASDHGPDGKVHVFFSAAPVLEDPNHAPQQQPYFFIELINETTSESLWSTFNFANESGVSWQNGTSGYLFTDWQSYDIPLDASKVQNGDKVKFNAIAAGCSLTGHAGGLYLRDVRTSRKVQAPSLTIGGVGPEKACLNNSGPTKITYTYTFENNGDTDMNNVEIDLNMPKTSDGDDTTFVSITNPSGGSCAAPAAAGALALCDVGTLEPGDKGTFTMTVEIPADATGATLNNGDYGISGEYGTDDKEFAELGTIIRTPMDDNCTVTPIPTIGEWAMILLAGLLGLFGMARLSRRRS